MGCRKAHRAARVDKSMTARLAGRVLAHVSAAGLAIASVVLPPGPLAAETLSDALAAAYVGNPALEAERARQRATTEELAKANSGWQPTIRLEAEGALVDREGRPSTLNEELETEHYGMRLSQPIFRGFRTINARRRAKAQIQAGESELLNASQNLLVEAVSAYSDVIRSRQVLRLRRQNVHFLKTELDQSIKRFRRGDLTRTDVSQARARHHEGLASLAEAKADRETSEAVFYSVIGHMPGRLAKPRPLNGLLPRNLEEMIHLAKIANPSIASAEQTHKAAHHQLREVEGELLPTVSLDAHYTRDLDESRTIDRKDEGFVGLRVDVPLYQGGNVWARVREATANRARRQYEATDVVNRVRAQAERAWQNHVASRARVRATRHQSAAARSALKGVRIEVRAGQRAFFEVLDAQREVVTAEVAAAQAMRDMTVAEYTVLAVIGRLTPEALGLPLEAVAALPEDGPVITGSVKAETVSDDAILTGSVPKAEAASVPPPPAPPPGLKAKTEPAKAKPAKVKAKAKPKRALVKQAATMPRSIVPDIKPQAARKPAGKPAKKPASKPEKTPARSAPVPKPKPDTVRASAGDDAPPASEADAPEPSARVHNAASRAYGEER